MLVHFGGERPITYMSPSLHSLDSLTRVHLQYLSGVHYNPVIEVEGYECNLALEPVSPPIIILDTDADDTPGVHCDHDCDQLGELVPVDPKWCEKHQHTHHASVILTYKV